MKDISLEKLFTTIANYSPTMTIFFLAGIGILFGTICTLSILLTNTERTTTRTCEDVIYYPKGEIICEVRMEKPGNVVFVTEVE